MTDFEGVPYADSESAGVQLNPAGRKLTVEARKALVATRRETPILVAATARVAASLERQDSERLSTYLRLLMLAALSDVDRARCGRWSPLRWSRRRRESAKLLDAQRQTADILGTVKDGLFLLDERARIGATHSASLERLFKRTDLAGISFEELLKPARAREDPADGAAVSSRCSGRSAPAKTW